MIRRTRLVRRTPIRTKRPGPPRRGQLTSAQKEAARALIYQLSGGKCELRLHPQCSGNNILPWSGSVFERWHLVHVRAKRRFGWPTSGPDRIRGGCYWCHIVMLHQKGAKAPELPQ